MPLCHMCTMGTGALQQGGQAAPPPSLAQVPGRCSPIKFPSLPQTAEMGSRINACLVYEDTGISTSTEGDVLELSVPFLPLPGLMNWTQKTHRSAVSVGN